MSLGDVVVERQLSNEEARQAICSLWNLQQDEVLIVNDLAELVSMNDPRRVLCNKWHNEGGQFATVLSFHEGEFMDQPREATAEKLSRVLRCRCLVCDASDDPYRMMMYCGDGQAQLVDLNSEKLDDGKYEIKEMLR